MLPTPPNPRNDAAHGCSGIRRMRPKQEEADTSQSIPLTALYLVRFKPYRQLALLNLRSERDFLHQPSVLALRVEIIKKKLRCALVDLIIRTNLRRWRERPLVLELLFDYEARSGRWIGNCRIEFDRSG